MAAPLPSATMPDMSSPHPAPRAVLSPCVGVCAIAADGLCEGCHRTLDEIARWGSMDNEARHEVWRAIHARRTSRPDP